MPRLRALLCRRLPHHFRISYSGDGGWELRCARCERVVPGGKRSVRFAEYPRAGLR